MPVIIRNILIAAVAVVTVAAAAAVIRLGGARQPATAPQPPAAVTYDGKTWDCAAVRQAWAGGNMDRYGSYPATVAFRCTVP